MTTSTKHTDDDGNHRWTTGDGRNHRLDGPAVEYTDGTKEWWVDGKLHRTDGPAIERADGTKEWCVDNKRHRLNGPAIEHANGEKSWWVDSKLHRTDGPAIERANGTKEWLVDGKRHRLDGPAIERADGTKEWWEHGESKIDFRSDEEVWLAPVRARVAYARYAPEVVLTIIGSADAPAIEYDALAREDRSYPSPWERHAYPVFLVSALLRATLDKVEWLCCDAVALMRLERHAEALELLRTANDVEAAASVKTKVVTTVARELRSTLYRKTAMHDYLRPTDR